MSCVAVSARSSGCTGGGSFPWARQEFEPTRALGTAPLCSTAVRERLPLLVAIQKDSVVP